MISVFDASPTDISRIQQLAERTWWPTYSPFLSKDQIRYMLDTVYDEHSIREAIKNGSQHFILLAEHDELQGFASYGPFEGYSDSWKIFKLYVLPENHGKGFGKKLVDEIIGRARREGVTSLILNVNRNNPALSFYKRNGFTIWREEDIPIGSYWMNDYVMRLTLD